MLAQISQTKSATQKESKHEPPVALTGTKCKLIMQGSKSEPTRLRPGCISWQSANCEVVFLQVVKGCKGNGSKRMDPISLTEISRLVAACQEWTLHRSNLQEGGRHMKKQLF